MWHLWQHIKILKELTGIEPRLASWDKSDHPSQIRLRAYLEDLLSRLSPLPESGPLFLDLTVDVDVPSRLLHQYDLENYLTPLFGTNWLPHNRFAHVTARKQVGGGSSIRIGRAGPLTTDDEKRQWLYLSVHAGSGPDKKQWKQRIHDAFTSARAAPLDEGPVEVRTAWRCSPRRNWVSLWKPTGDAMGPILGYAGKDNPFHPRDDRIVRLDLHLVKDEHAGNNVDVGVWWRHLVNRE